MWKGNIFVLAYYTVALKYNNNNDDDDDDDNDDDDNDNLFCIREIHHLSIDYNKHGTKWVSTIRYI